MLRLNETIEISLDKKNCPYNCEAKFIYYQIFRALDFQLRTNQEHRKRILKQC
jgi:hypothetical protein